MKLTLALLLALTAAAQTTVTVDPPLALNKNSGHLSVFLPPPVAAPPPPAAPAIDPGPGAVLVDANTIQIAGACSLTTPCHASIHYASINSNQISFGTRVVEFVSASMVTMAPDPTRQLRIYLSDGSDNAPIGTLVVANSLPGGVTCDAQCVVLNNVTQFAGVAIAAFGNGVLKEMRSYLN